MNFDVLCVGEMVIDFTPGKEEGSYIRNPGGAPGNVAVAVSRFGFKSAFCGKLGNDDFGKFLMQVLQADGVEIVCREFTDEAITTLAFVTLSDNGERSFTFARKPGADMLLKVEDINPIFIQSSTIVHAGSCSLSAGSAREATKYALQMGNKLGKLISFDINYRSLMWESVDAAVEQVKDILPYVDILKVADDEVFLIGGEEQIPAVMKANGITVVVLTCGSEGSRAYFNGSVIPIHAIPAEVVADTNGAGDAFWGGFISSLLEQGVTSMDVLLELHIKNALRFGTVAGWLTVQKHGAISALPTKAQVQSVFD
ncbi:MAG: carbohydrate kinase family protein [Ruminiclostridium sp.]